MLISVTSLYLSTIGSFLEKASYQLRKDELEEIFAALRNNANNTVSREFNYFEIILELLVQKDHFKSHTSEYAAMFRSLMESMPDEISKLIVNNVVDEVEQNKKFFQEFATGTHNGKSGMEIINLVLRKKKNVFNLAMVCGKILRNSRSQFVEEFDFAAFVKTNSTELAKHELLAYSYRYESVIFLLMANEIAMQKIFEVMPEPISVIDGRTNVDLAKYIKQAYFNHGFIPSAPSFDVEINGCANVTYRGKADFVSEMSENPASSLGKHLLQARGQGSSVFNIEGCYGKGTYTGEHVNYTSTNIDSTVVGIAQNSVTKGDGIWIHEDGKVKAEGNFSGTHLGWCCKGKLFDTESNTVIFDGELSNSGKIEGQEFCLDGSIFIGTFKNNLRDGWGSYTNSTYTAKGLWCEGKKNSHFIEKTVGAGQSALYYEDDVLCGGLAYKRPRTRSLFFNSLKKRFFKISEGVLFYYSGHLDLIEKGHLDLQYYDVYDSKSKRVVRKEPYSIVLRCVNTVGVFEKREIVLYFEEWKDNWPQLKETWLKLIRDGIEYAVLKNKKESKAMSGFTQAYETEMEISDASAPDSAPSEGGDDSLEDRS